MNAKISLRSNWKISVKYLNAKPNIFIEFNWQYAAIKDNEIKLINPKLIRDKCTNGLKL